MADKRPKFGQRHLQNADDMEEVFQHNAWDNMPWTNAQEMAALQAINANSEITLTLEQIEQLDLESHHYWDAFYAQHKDGFFKDRHWLLTEFPELDVDSGAIDDGNNIDGKLEQLREAVEEMIGKIARHFQGRMQMKLEAIEDGNIVDGNVYVQMKQIETKLVEINEEISAEMDEKMWAKCVGSLQGINAKIQQIQQRRGAENGGNSAQMGEKTDGNSEKFTIFELGCGVGNTVFPVLQSTAKCNLQVYCCDFSPKAIDILHQSPFYTQEKDRLKAFVLDITTNDWSKQELPFAENSIDVMVLIYCLSAIDPKKMPTVVQQMLRFLRPGGRVLFRDYGRYDMAQLRFKPGQCLAENFYARGDKTRVYFFTQDEIRDLFLQNGYEELENRIDRRLQVNRGKKLTMFRIWIQAKYRKPIK